MGKSFFMTFLILLLFIAASAFASISVKPFGPEIEKISADRDFNEPLQFYTFPSALDPLQIATDFISERVKTLHGFSFVVKDAYKSSNNVTHVYLKQTFQGLEVVNGDLNINIDGFGRVLSYENSFFNSDEANVEFLEMDRLVMPQLGDSQHIFSPSEHDDILTPVEAISSLASYLGLNSLDIHELKETIIANDQDSLFHVADAPVFRVSNVGFAADSSVYMTQKYLIINTSSDYKLIPVWDISVDFADGDNWLNVQMHMKTGTVHQLVDWVSSAAYNVHPIGVNDPSDGERTLLIDPQDETASPIGWHRQTLDGTEYNTTISNNVYAQENEEGYSNYLNNYRPVGSGKSSTDLTFDFPIDFTKEPKTYLNASIVQLFFLNNIIHDIFYHYGFDEKAGNFQENNFKRGGRDGDAVIANAQDGSGINNANFATPPDGMKPRMRMYIWKTSPDGVGRDGDLETGIVVHEYGHGISNRLTGGPMNSNCLGYGESGGMGEGWSDVFATMLRMRPYYNSSMDFTMGEYSAGRGIRPFPYSTSLTTNPHTYSWIKKPAYNGKVHHIGSVWASILYEVYWNVVNQYGFDPDWFAVKSDYNKAWAGNLRVLYLIVDGMKLQPCRPNFVDARNAIIRADEVRFDGEHFCLLWQGFAKRGLGVEAKAGVVDSFELPKECR